MPTPAPNVDTDTKIAVAAASSTQGSTSVYVIPVDAAQVQQVFSSVAESPAWSPDGKKIALVNPAGSAPHIWVINADGSNRIQLTNGGGEIDPVWSKDGNSLFYAATDFGETTHRIERINIDGTNKAVIVNDGRDARHPAISPDGQRITFSSLIAGTSRYALEIMTIGGVRSTLFADENSNVRASWSVENTIAYESIQPAGGSRIYTIATDGSGRAILQIGNPQLSVGSPSWSPDGKRLAMWVINPGTTSGRLLGVWRTGNLFTTYNIPLNLDVTFVAWSPFIR